MSSRTRNRSLWTCVALVFLILILIDINDTAARRQDADAKGLFYSQLTSDNFNSNAVVGVCNSLDASLGALQAAVNATLNYDQVDSISRLAVQRGGGLADIIQPGDWVVIKPNFLVVPGVTSGTYTWAHNGVTTDLRVIKSVIEQLIEEGDASRITVAEGACWRKNGDPVVPEQTIDGWNYHWAWFGNLAVDDMVAELDALTPDIIVDYIDLNYPPYTETAVPGGGLSQATYYIPDAILNCDRLIAIAAMKTHNMARVTLTSKLFVGISPASYYTNGKFDHMRLNHTYIDRTIVDLMSYHPPDFGIVECFWGTEGSGPLGGSAIQRNLVLAGKDPVAVDAASVYTMGMNPWDIDHLHWAHAKGFGTNNLDYINIVGPSLDDVRYTFARAISEGRGNRIWLINGTYSGTDLNYDYLGGNETIINPVEGQFDGGHTWDAFTDISDYMNLATHYGYPSSCITYAFTRIYADNLMNVRLHFGADDGIKVILNGTTIYTSSGSESYSMTAHDLPLTLQPGMNRLLVKIRNTSGGYGFGMRVSETNGDTPLGIAYDINSPGAPAITVNNPADGATVVDTAMTLSVSVTDPENDSITVNFYGDTVTPPTDLLYTAKVASGSTVDYNWHARRLKAVTGTFGLWHFDEGTGDVLYDASGNGLDGYWHCDSTKKSMWTRNGAFGYGLDFFGYHTGTLFPENPCAADYVEVPDDEDLDVDPDGQLSMEFWINPDCLPPVTGYTCDTARYWGIFTKRIPCTTATDSIPGCGSPANYCIFYNYPTQTIGFYGNTTLYTSTCTLTPGIWQYIVVTIDGATQDLRFYKNGQLVQARTGDIGNLVEGPLRIGSSAYRRKGVDGKIDELRLSRRILSADEIANNYKLATGTYYWYVTATDGTESSNSAIRSFTLQAPGPDADPPVITLNSPGDGYVTPNEYMTLDATVADASSTDIWVYGGTESDPGALLKVVEDVSGSQNVTYNWNAARLGVESPNTMGLWHFDAGIGTTLLDSSGNANNGTFAGAPVWSTGGKFGYALDFDGVDDYVSIPDAASLDIDSAAGEMTIEAWIYPHTSGGEDWKSIISKKAMGGGGGVNYQISLDKTTGNLLFYSGHWPQIWISSVAIPLNQWSYVAVTLRATEGRLRFYRNGVLLDSTVTFAGSGGCFGAANSTVLTIGTAGIVGECFDGMIDEVRLTRRVLTNSEIAANYKLSNGTYYWKVAALDVENNSASAGPRHFVINTAGSAPEIPALLTPTNASTITDATPTFTWSATAGSGGTYTLEYSTDPAFGVGPTVTVSGLTAATYTPTTPLAEDDWYWHVSATNAYGSSGYQASAFSFTLMIDNEAPVIVLNSPPDGSATSYNYESLSATVTDASPMTVWLYGGTGGTAANLLYVWTGESSGDFDYDWTANVLPVEATYTKAMWRFEENNGTTTVDSSSNGNTCTFSGAPIWTTGRFGRALDFDGTDDYVWCPDNSTLDILPTGGLTVEAWVYPHSVGGGHWRAIVAKRNLGGSVTNYEVCLDQTSGNLLFYSGSTIWTSDVAVPANQWSYLAVTVDGSIGTARFYRNGIQGTPITGVTIGAVNDHGVYIGMANAVTECFDGLIDEVRISSRVLTPSEILDNSRLKMGTYYWQYSASDGINGMATSATWDFQITTDAASPLVTLVSPINGYATLDNHMLLEATVSDQNSMTVWAYGGRTAAANDLLKVWTGVTTGTMQYDWLYPPLQNETGYTMALWHMNEGTGTAVADASGNNNNGTFNGDPAWISSVPFGYGLDLDGTGDFYTVPDAASLDISPTTGAITMEAWVYPTRTGGGYETIIGKWSSTSNINYQMSLHTTSDNLLFYSGSGGSIWTSDVNVPINQWSYIAITLDASDHIAHFYRNGVEGTPISSVNIGTINTAPITIGATSTAGNEAFWGRIDEVRLTNRKLSSAEIAANYELNSGRYYWKFAATDGSNPTTTSEVWYFDAGTMPAPPIPTLLLPADLAQTNDITPAFFWSHTAGTGGTYTLEYSTASDFSSNVTTISSLSDTTYTAVSALAPGTWYWHVQAHNTGGASGYQPTPFSFILDTQAPQAPTSFAVTAGHQEVHLAWVNPGTDFAGAMIRRNPWHDGAYPEYDDLYPSPLGYPATPFEGTLVYQGTGTSFDDPVVTRNVYYYSIFAYDSAGNYSGLTSAQNGRATNYWLGDVSGDGNVFFEDLGPLSLTYWTTPDSGSKYNPQFDIGPTVTGSPRGIPTTDNVINFEDLVIFSLNYDVVHPGSKIAPILGGAAFSEVRSLSAQSEKNGDNIWVLRVSLQNSDDGVKALRFTLPYNRNEIEFLGGELSEPLKNCGYPFFFDSRSTSSGVDISLALLGGITVIGGSGEIATIRFRGHSGEFTTPGFGLVEARDAANRPLKIEFTSANEPPRTIMPTSFSLGQNYPNPCNLQTMISYQLPHAGAVTIRIYNIAGQMVRTLVDETRAAGYHSVIWDGRNDEGQEVGSGIYFYQMTTGDFSASRKMVLLK